MMEKLESVPAYERKRVDRLVSYMQLMNVDPARYWIGPEAHLDVHAGVAAAGFSPELNEQADSVTYLKLPFVIEQPPLVTGLVAAVRYIVHLLSEPNVADRLRRVDPEAEDGLLLANLGIDVVTACRPSVKT